MADPISTPPAASRRYRRGIIIAAAVIGVIATLFVTKAVVFAQAPWRHGWGGPMNAEVIADRVEHGVKYVLSDVDATAEQKSQVTVILQAAAKDVAALREQHHADAARIREILSAPTVDRASLETVRANELRLADQASKRILQGIADSAEVLTPEQRVQLADKLEARRRRHGG